MSSLTGPVQAEYQDLFTSSSTQNGLNLGATAQTGDGRTFVFALVGATALVPGKLYQSQAETTAWENLSVTATAIGSTTITTTSTVTITANALAGGYVMVSVTPGQGYSYKIKANTAATAATTTITLEDPILVALTTGSTITLVPSPFNSIIINPTTASGAVVGAAIYPIAASQYGWIQTQGTAAILAQGTIVVGEQVAASSTTAGAIVATSGVLASVGYAVQGITSTNYGPIFLNL